MSKNAAAGPSAASSTAMPTTVVAGTAASNRLATDAGTGGTHCNIDASKPPAKSHKRKEPDSSDKRDFAAEKARRKDVESMSPKSQEMYKNAKGTKRKQEFRDQYQEEKKMRSVTSTKVDERVETKEEFETGLYLSRSRIIQAEGGTNPDKDDIVAGDEHIMWAIKKGGRWLTLPPGVLHRSF